MKASEFDQVLKMKRELEELADKLGADVSLVDEGDGQGGSGLLIAAKDRTKTGPFGNLFDTVEEARAFLQGMIAGKRVEYYEAKQA